MTLREPDGQDITAPATTTRRQQTLPGLSIFLSSIAAKETPFVVLKKARRLDAWPGLAWHTQKKLIYLVPLKIK